MELREIQAHEANLKAYNNKVLARLYLYCLKKNYNPIDTTISGVNSNRTTITFGINNSNYEILDKLIEDSMDKKLLDLIKVEKVSDRLFLTMGAIINDNGNMLNSYLLRQLFSYDNKQIEVDNFISRIYKMNKEGLIDYNFSLVKEDENIYELYKVIDEEIVNEDIAEGILELEKLLKRFNSLDLQKKRK